MVQTQSKSRSCTRSQEKYCDFLITMLPFWARLIALSAQGHLEVTVLVFLYSGGSWWFFEEKIYIKLSGRWPKNTYVLSLFSDIFFACRCIFSDIFSLSPSLTGVISFFENFFHFIFLMILYGNMRIYMGWFILLQASHRPWNEDMIRFLPLRHITGC